ncbi:MAG: M28 family peptidase [Acidobacteriota bacterium]|nr:MAG: M28 family peptidase [Acidobacteriota bacterium]
MHRDTTFPFVRGRFLLKAACGIALAALVVAATACTGPSCRRGGEQRLLKKLDAARALEETRIFAEAVDDPSGLGMGTASPGSEQEAALADYVEEKFRAIGLGTERHTFPVRVFRYGPVGLTVGGESIPAVILYGSPGTYGTRDGQGYKRGNANGDETLRAPLVYAGTGTRDDIAAAGDVKGKILLLLRDDNATGWPSLMTLEASTHGAAAIVMFGVEGEETLLPEALRQDSVLYCNPIPAFSISRTNGERLREELSQRPMETELSCSAEELDGTSVNVLGSLRGSRFPDEWILVSAHMDRWFQAYLDNSSGIGAMLELARAVTERGTPRRSFLFAAVGSEEAGGIQSLDEWLAGSYALVKDKPDLFEHTALVLNLDSVGWRGESGYANVSPEGVPFAEALLKDRGLDSRVEIVPQISIWVDAWCYSSVGGATTFSSEWDISDYWDYYHTDHDAYEEGLLANLETDLQLYLLALHRADCADDPPLDFAAVASWARTAYEEDAARVPDVSFDSLWAALSSFEEAAADDAKRLESAREEGDDVLARLNAHRLAVRSELIPALVATDMETAQARTYRYSVDAERLAKIAEVLQRPVSSVADRRARIAEALEIMEEGDEFQDHTIQPSWTFRFSSRTLEKLMRMSEEMRTWSREHDHLQHSLSLEVFSIHEEMRRKLDRPLGFNAARAAGAAERLRDETVARLEANMARASEALAAAAERLRANP